MEKLTEMQQDVVSEPLNSGMGAAAAALSQMVGEEVSLSVPHVELLTHQEASGHRVLSKIIDLQ